MSQYNDKANQTQKAPDMAKFFRTPTKFSPPPPAIEVDNDNTLASLYTPPVTVIRSGSR